MPQLTYLIVLFSLLIFLAVSFWIFARLSGHWHPMTRRLLQLGILLVLSGALVVTVMLRR
jgi:hypothetical protein